MLASLLLLATHALVAPSPLSALPDDPPVRVWFNSDGNYGFADRAKVYVKSPTEGYVIVLRADTDGRVRVLFPLDPPDDQRIAADKKYELKGRGGREAFIADDSTGHGTVLAAISSSPFRVDGFARDGHWDLRALSAQRNGEDDAETVLSAGSTAPTSVAVASTSDGAGTSTSDFSPSSPFLILSRIFGSSCSSGPRSRACDH